jgi:hypothetical protein
LWEGRLQIELTEAVISGITGRYTRLLRPPYSSTPDAVRGRDDRALAALAGSRYFVVLANYDSKDWQRPGVGRIVANSTPRGSTGGIVMLHDGGGNRSQTVAAVRDLIIRLKARGFQLVTVSQLAGLRTRIVEPRAGGWAHLRGSIFIFSVRVAYALTTVFSVILVAIGALVLLRAVLLFLLASHQVRGEPRPGEPRPDHEWRTLWELADVLDA